MRDRVIIKGRWISWGLCALLCAISLGCGGGEKIPELYSVSGKVTYNGKPVPEAKVTFFLDEKLDPRKTPQRPCSAIADEGGNYVLYWNGGDNEGAPLGKYKVSIIAFEKTGPDHDSEQKPPSLIPERYGNPNTSGYAPVVKDEENTFNFDLDDNAAGAPAASGARDE